MKKQKAGCGPHCEQTVAVMRQIRWITKSKRRRVSEWIGGKFGGLYPPSSGFFYVEDPSSSVARAQFGLLVTAVVISP